MQHHAPLATTPTLDDDNIDLIALFKTLWQHKKQIILITLCSAALALVYSLVSPQEYKAETSFFLSSSDKPSGALMGYASMLGMDTPSNIESLLKSVLDSYSIKAALADAFKDNFKHDIETALSKQSLNHDPAHITAFIIDALKLKKAFTYKTNKDGLFTLSYSSTNKERCKVLLDTALELIIAYNETLELSAEKNIITVVDPPRLPLESYKPKILLNLLLGLVLGGFSSVVFVFVKSGLKQYYSTH